MKANRKPTRPDAWSREASRRESLRATMRPDFFGKYSGFFFGALETTIAALHVRSASKSQRMTPSDSKNPPLSLKMQP